MSAVDVAEMLADGDRAHRPPELRSQWRIAPCGHLSATGYHRCGEDESVSR